ncbi:MAG: hypothetical protein Q9M97_10105 [Candidatus Gracilibacteria bacterium]|nr:hypothetical protein [Candidatus Gracilibacteria bacterium]
MMSLIEEIALNGIIFQMKEDTFYEKYDFYKITYKISYLKEGFYFIILIGEKENGKLVLLSCFIKEQKKINLFGGLPLHRSISTSKLIFM